MGEQFVLAALDWLKRRHATHVRVFFPIGGLKWEFDRSEISKHVRIVRKTDLPYHLVP